MENRKLQNFLRAIICASQVAKDFFMGVVCQLKIDPSVETIPIFTAQESTTLPSNL